MGWGMAAMAAATAYSASKQSDAAEGASQTQAQAIDRAAARQERHAERTREDLAPFRRMGEQAVSGLTEQVNETDIRPAREAMGTLPQLTQTITSGDTTAAREAVSTLPELTSLVTDPRAQRRFITENPFYETLADDAQERIFQNKAARGKLGSGGTAEALQDNLLALGSDLLNQNIAQRRGLIGMGADLINQDVTQRQNLVGLGANLVNQNTSQRQNLVSMGQNAAAQTGSFGSQAASNISNLQTQRGNVLAAGQVGSQRAYTQGLNNLMSTGTNLYALNKMYG